MAFESKNVSYHEPQRGIGGFIVYTNMADTTDADMIGVNYFNDNGIRAFIRNQRDSAGADAAARAANPVPFLLIGSNKMEWRAFVVSDASVVSQKGGGGFPISP